MRQWMVVVGATAALAAITIAYQVGRARANGIPQGDGALTYSGYLEQTGQPVQGDKEFLVELFDGVTSPEVICAAGPATLSVSQGRFSVPLPAACVSAVRGNPEVWVQVTVGAGAQSVALPRSRISAVPFSVEAEHAESATTASSAAQAATAVVAGGATGELSKHIRTAAAVAMCSSFGPGVGSAGVFPFRLPNDTGTIVCQRDGDASGHSCKHVVYLDVSSSHGGWSNIAGCSETGPTGATFACCDD